MSRKLLFSAVGGIAVVIVGMAWLIRDVRDVGLWIAWFGAVNAIIGVYAAGNVAQSRVISEHYREELVDK